MVRMTQLQHIPDGLPRLSRGTHITPEAGACFMEYASVLAGEPWSDQPRCTHPVLGEVARMVNDSCTQVARDRLAPLIPSVIGLVSDDPGISPRLVIRLVEVARDLGVSGPVLEWHRRRALGRLRRLGVRPDGRHWGRLVDAGYREGPAMRAVSSVGYAVSRLPDSRRDAGFRALLLAAIDLLAAEVHAGAAPADSTRPRAHPRTTPRSTP